MVRVSIDSTTGAIMGVDRDDERFVHTGNLLVKDNNVLLY